MLRQELIFPEGSPCQLQGVPKSGSTGPFLTLSPVSPAATADARDAAEDAAADAGPVRGRYLEGRRDPPVTI